MEPDPDVHPSVERRMSREENKESERRALRATGFTVGTFGGEFWVECRRCRFWKTVRLTQRGPRSGMVRDPADLATLIGHAKTHEEGERWA
jgi:hypothetical protein